MRDFANFDELLNHKEASIIFDLRNYVSEHKNPKYEDMFLPPERGVYVQGILDPIVNLDKPHYLRSQLVVNAGPGNDGIFNYRATPTIQGLGQIMEAKCDVINAAGDVVLSARDIRSLGKMFKDKPDLPIQAIRLALVATTECMNEICRHTRFGNPPYNPMALVKETHWAMLDNHIHHAMFRGLLDEVATFVGDDNWHLYHYKVKGSTLVLEKTIDYRIYKFHADIFEKQDTE